MTLTLRTGLLFFLFSGSVFGQAKLKKQHIINPCEKEEQTFLFTPKGKVSEETLKTTDTKGRTITNRTIYEFDKDKIARVQYVCNDTLVREETSEYLNGDLVHFRRMLKGKLALDEAYTYKRGQLIRLISTTPNGVLIKDVTYDNFHHTKESVTKSGTTVTEVVKEHTEGNTTTIEYLNPPFVKPTLVKVLVYDYNGNVIDERTLNHGIEEKRTVNRFDNNIPASKKEFENGKLVLDVLYDEYGNPLREQDFVKGTITIYENKFNSQHNLREVKVIRGDKQECVKQIENEYWN